MFSSKANCETKERIWLRKKCTEFPINQWRNCSWNIRLRRMTDTQQWLDLLLWHCRFVFNKSNPWTLNSATASQAFYKKLCVINPASKGLMAYSIILIKYMINFFNCCIAEMVECKFKKESPYCCYSTSHAIWFKIIILQNVLKFPICDKIFLVTSMH